MNNSCTHFWWRFGCIYIGWFLSSENKGPRIHFQFSCEVWSESHSVMSHSLWHHGILQARILEWIAFPLSRGCTQPRDQTQVSYIAGRFFTSWATRVSFHRHCQIIFQRDYVNLNSHHKCMKVFSILFSGGGVVLLHGLWDVKFLTRDWTWAMRVKPES